MPTVSTPLDDLMPFTRLALRVKAVALDLEQENKSRLDKASLEQTVRERPKRYTKRESAKFALVIRQAHREARIYNQRERKGDNPAMVNVSRVFTRYRRYLTWAGWRRTIAFKEVKATIVIESHDPDSGAARTLFKGHVEAVTEIVVRDKRPQ
jgi:hypothetical protein